MAPGLKTLAVLATGIVAALVIAAAPANAASGEQGVHITKLIIEPRGPDFNVTVHYSTSFMTKIFSLLFGARVVQPGIVDQLDGFGDVRLASIDTYNQVAKLTVKNQSRPFNGMYLYDGDATFPVAIDLIQVTGDAIDQPLNISNAAEVPAFFYRINASSQSSF